MQTELAPDSSGRRPWFGRRSKPSSGVPLRPASPPAGTDAEMVALYRRAVQAASDQGVEVWAATVTVCGVGPMLVTADDAGLVELVPIAVVPIAVEVQDTNERI